MRKRHKKELIKQDRCTSCQRIMTTIIGDRILCVRCKKERPDV